MRLKVHPIVTQTRRDRYRPHELQGTLDEGPELRDVLELVELAQRAGLSPDVVEVQPVVALALEVDARRQPLLERAERQWSADAETSAVVKAFEVDVREGRGILEAA